MVATSEGACGSKKVIPNLFRKPILRLARHSGFVSGVLKQVQHDLIDQLFALAPFVRSLLAISEFL